MHHAKTSKGRQLWPQMAAAMVAPQYLGAEVGAVDLGVESRCHGGSTSAFSMPPRCIFCVKIHGAVMCYLDIMDHGAELGVHFSKLLGCICEIFLPKGLKRKKKVARSDSKSKKKI
jgi:hypothetical protein